MKKEITSFFAVLFVLVLTVMPVYKGVMAANATDVVITSENAVSFAATAEAKYDRLMRTYINKIKIAFTETDDTKTVEILNQFAQQFDVQAKQVKTDLENAVKYLKKSETEALANRLDEKSRSGELISLLFDEKVSNRMESNPQIKAAVDTLLEKNLEFQQQEYLASN